MVDVKDQQRSNRLTIFISAIKSTVKFMDSSASFTPLVLQPLFNIIMNSPLIIRNKKTFIEFDEWLMQTKSKSNKNIIKLFDPLETVISQDFCMNLFLNYSSSSVGNLIASLMKDASSLSENHFNSIQFWHWSLNQSERKIYLTNMICNLINFFLFFFKTAKNFSYLLILLTWQSFY